MPSPHSSPLGVRVESVARASIAEEAGLAAGDRILSVSGKTISDLLDLHFLTSRNRFLLRWATPEGEERERTIRTAGKPLGVFPEPVRVRRCRNRCIFCFVHQLPKGMRRSLYIKDEDVRLSFLHGQYVTFSDISEEEIRKIIRYGLSPLYVSSGDPDHSAPVNHDTADQIEAIRLLHVSPFPEACPASGSRIKPVKTTSVGGDPDLSPGILRNGGNAVTADGIGIFPFIPVPGDRTQLRIQSCSTIRTGPCP